jgi:hypothetical protein
MSLHRLLHTHAARIWSADDKHAVEIMKAERPNKNVLIIHMMDKSTNVIKFIEEVQQKHQRNSTVALCPRETNTRTVTA